MDYLTQGEVPAVWGVGDIIVGLYEVKQVFTGGGMGLVYRVAHRGWNMDLAVKSPRREYLRTASQKDSFVRECETWIGLGLHPHIVSCHYVRTLGGIPRVFAEFVDGGSLREWIDDGRLYEGGRDEALKRVLDVAVQMAWGLFFAHEKGLVHQDMKPGNVLLTLDGDAKVTDFGLAKARVGVGEGDGSATVLASCGGMTPAYCSPEQAEGLRLSSKTDVWSWAVTVFEMFAGEPPCRHGGQFAGEIFAAYCENDAEGAIAPLPAGVADVLEDCFQRDPARRPKDLKCIAERIGYIYAEMFNEVYPRAEPKAVELLADELNNRALSLRDLGRHAESAGVMREALKANPGHLPAVFNSGVLAWRSGQVSDFGLLTDIRAIRKSDSNSWTAAYAEGLVHLERSDIVSATVALQESVRLGGDVVVERALEKATALREKGVGSAGVFEGKTDIAIPVLMTPDERGVISCDADKTLRLWDVGSRRCVRAFDGAGSGVAAAAIAGNGSLIVAGCGDRTLRFCDFQTGRCLRVVRDLADVPKVVAADPTGRYAISAGAGEGGDEGCLHEDCLRLWDLSTGRELRVLRGHSGVVLATCFSADGEWIISGGWDNTVRLWSSGIGRCEQVLRGHGIAITSVALSRCLRWAVSGSMDSTMRLWELKTGRCLRVFPHSDMVYSVSLTADNQWALAAAWNGGMCLWHLPSGRCLRTFGLENPELSGVVSSALGAGQRYAVSKHMDRTMHLWSVASLCCRGPGLENVPLLISRPRAVKDLVGKQSRFSVLLAGARSAYVARRYGDALRLIDEARAVDGFDLAPAALELRAEVGLRCQREGVRRSCCVRTFKGHKGQVGAVCMGPDGKTVISGGLDSTVKVWDVATGSVVKTLVDGKWSVTCLAGGPANGNVVVSGNYDGTLRLWDIESGVCIRQFVGHGSYVQSVALSRDGRWMVSGSQDKTIKLWDLETGRCIRTFSGHTGGIYAVALSPDGVWMATGSFDSTIIWDDDTKRSGRLPGAKEKMLRLWHLATGKCVRILEGHTSGVKSVAFSEDGRNLVSWSDDRSLRVWDVETGLCLKSVQGGVKGVLSVDGRWAVSHGEGHSLRVLDLIRGKCVCVLEGHTDTVISSFLRADSRWVVSGSMDSTVRLWELDWDFAVRAVVDWDEGAQRFLANFIAMHRPYESQLPRTRQPEDWEVARALKHCGKASWTADDFDRLMGTLAAAGYGWLRPEGVVRELERMATESG